MGKADGDQAFPESCRVAPAAEVDALVTYVVKAEPRGNSACLIWGMRK